MDLNSVRKAIKGATKPSEEAPKEKHLRSIRKYLVQDSPISDIAFAQVSQLLVHKLSSPLIATSLKAHLIFHHLIADPTVKKYSFLNFVARYYSTPNRSSVDCTVGAGSSTTSGFIPNLPPLPPPPITPPQQFSIYSPPTSVSNSKSLSSKTAQEKKSNFLFKKLPNDLDDTYFESVDANSKKPLLPNLAHSISQSAEINRLISSYNRYLRERILHFRRLRLDIICEKVSGTSIVDTSNIFSDQFSGTLLGQMQCAIQQIRLLIACIFPDKILNIPLYAYSYGLVVKDLSILFRFLNIALVKALQNFFTLSRPNAERTLYVYKEYTQLQICNEVLAFVNQAPNSVLKTDIEIPMALQQDRKSIIKLTKSLENYLYEIKHSNEASKQNQREPQKVEKERSKQIQAKKLSESDVSDIISEQKSLSSTSSITSDVSLYIRCSQTKESNSIKTLNTSNSGSVLEPEGQKRNNSVRLTKDISKKQQQGPKMHNEVPPPIPRVRSYNNINRPYIRHTIHKSPFDPLFDEEIPPSISNSNFTQPSTFSDQRLTKNPFNNHLVETTTKVNPLNVEKYPANPSSTVQKELKVPSKSILRQSSKRSLHVATLNDEHRVSLVSLHTSLCSPPNLPPPPLPEMPKVPEKDISRTPRDGLPPNFDINDPSMENWKELFESLNNPEATFSLKFDIVAALQRSIKLYEEQQNEQKELEEQKKLNQQKELQEQKKLKEKKERERKEQEKKEREHKEQERKEREQKDQERKERIRKDQEQKEHERKGYERKDIERLEQQRQLERENQVLERKWREIELKQLAKQKPASKSLPRLQTTFQDQVQLQLKTSNSIPNSTKSSTESKCKHSIKKSLPPTPLWEKRISSDSQYSVISGSGHHKVEYSVSSGWNPNSNYFLSDQSRNPYRTEDISPTYGYLHSNPTFSHSNFNTYINS